MGKGGKRRAHARPPSAVRMRLDRLTREVAKFGAVGGAGLLVNLIAFNVVRGTTDLQVVRASVIATVVAIVSNYIGFRYFTYRDRDKSGRTKELTLFVLFSAVGLVIENGFLYAATYGLGLDSPLASNVFKFVGIGIATLFRFWSYRTWVFRAAPAREAVASAESFLENPEPYLQQDRQAYLEDEDRPTRQFRQVQRVR
ncbi:GtrA family protein [Streptomyces sp. ActVer]|uniref:GtrA family protein n=1 Tax=Streptomyces sp. ActVer TaxID=3014558 RepID=UPI0022B306C1|nr:GtrA family protein [Streptomyces sp. ActVer]MCZ4513480.1 GtrA family protein [Streptomyces sp. ActVer]